MYRTLLTQLEKWRCKANRKPLILSGARQVGKTWLLKEFGRLYFKNVAYIALDGNPAVANFFKAGYSDINRLIVGLSAATGVPMVPDETLLILDEIQVCPEALTSLKYWQETAPGYAVVAAGSLLGLQLQPGSGYPVGKTDALTLFPLSFGEFLMALEERGLAELIAAADYPLVKAFSPRLQEFLALYFFVGGMPAAVNAFLENRNPGDARSVQKALLLDFERDFAKHVPTAQVARLRAIWQSMPLQLSRQDKRFVAKEVPGVRQARDLHDPFVWLESAGLCHRVWNVTKPFLPLASYRNHLFKCFGVDVGLLAAQSAVPAKAILEKNRLFTEFKGALTEQYVQQELRAVCGIEPYYWAQPNSQAEVDFLIQSDDGVIPVEAKAERNLKAKSLSVYQDKYHPTLAIRTSLADYSKRNGLLDIPLYALAALPSELA